MRKPKYLILSLVFTAIALLSLYGLCWSATYYVDATLGSDASADPTNIATPWQTIAKVNSTLTGDQSDTNVLFKKGETWREQLTVPGSGTSGHPFTFGAYGSGADPILNGSIVVEGFDSFGHELVTNGTCDSDVLYWSNNAGTKTWTESFGGRSGVLKFTASGVANPFTGPSSAIYDASGSTVYQISYKYYILSTNGSADGVQSRDGSNEYTWINYGSTLDAWTTVTVQWTPAEDRSIFYIYLATASQTPGATNGDIVYFDDMSLKEVLPTNVYRATVGFDPDSVWFGGYLGVEKASIATLTTNRDWYWAGNVLYIYHSGSLPTIEVGTIGDVISISGKKYITLDGLTVKQANGDGVMGSNDVDGLIIQNCSFIANFYNGVTIVEDEDTISDVTISGNSFTYNGAGGFASQVKFPDNWLITGNTANYNAQVSSDNTLWYQAAGIYLHAATGAEQSTNTGFVTITLNTANYNGSTLTLDSPNAAYSGQGIYSDTCNNVTITRNNTSNNWGCGYMIEKASNNVISYNISVNDNQYGQTLANSVFADQPASIKVRAGEDVDATGHHVYNNVVYGGWHGIDVGAADTSLINNTVVRNNIVVSNHYQLYINPGGNNDVTHGSGNVYDHNCFGAEGATLAYWTGTGAIATYDNLETAYGSAMNNVESDPLFVNAAGGDFRLQLGSPAINAGVGVGLVTDYSGFLVGATPEIGAFESGNAPRFNSGGTGGGVMQ